MRGKILIALLLLVLLPLALLGWLGIRLVASEQQAVSQRVQALVSAKLQIFDTAILDYFSQQQSTLLTLAGNLTVEPDALRVVVAENPQLRQVFAMDAEGKRLHPPLAGALSEYEKRFLNRTQGIWNDLDILYQPASHITLPAQPVSKLSSHEVQASSDDSEPSYGWYIWYWGSETNLIFWYRDSAQRLLGFELEPARILADIISRLPASGDDLASENYRIHLIDNNGITVYQWGEYETQETSTALVSYPVSFPLGSWRLAYFAAPLTTEGTPFWLVIIAVFTTLGIVLIGLAYYLYREHTRSVRLAQQRVNFVNQVSHELKTPLTNIRMYAELLDDQLLAIESEEEQRSRRYLEVIVAESQRLSRLINNVLNFAGLQKDRLALNKRQHSLDTIVANVVKAFQLALANKTITIELDTTADRMVWVDPDVVEQILNNLLSNVEKYALSGGRVEISTWQENENSFIRVQDNGPGIPENERERIFKPFYRISSKLSDGVTGTGIGLTITRQLARLHGGDLQLIATKQGACFQVYLNTAQGKS